MAHRIGVQRIVWDATYHKLNGRLDGLDLKLSNLTVSMIISNALFEPSFAGDYGRMLLQQAWTLTGASSSTSTRLAQNFANRVSQVSAAQLAGQVSPRVTLKEQIRSQPIVTRVPKTPFWIHIGVNLLYAMVGLTLTVLAILAVRNNLEVQQIQTRLSLPGLIAELFEKPHCERAAMSSKELFRESEEAARSRISLTKTAARGWRYSLWS